MESSLQKFSPSGDHFVSEWESAQANVEAFPASALDRTGGCFSGSLKTLAVTDLVQVLQMSHNSALLTLRNEQTQGQLWCVNGAIVDAQSGLLRGEAAAYRLLCLQEGWMVAVFGPVTRTEAIHKPLQHLLFESARRKDEVARLFELLGGPQKTYQLQPFGNGTLEIALKGEKSRVFQRLGNATSLERLLAVSALGDLETLLAVDDWVRSGVLVGRGLEEKATNSYVGLGATASFLDRSSSSLTPLVSETSSCSTVRSRGKFEPWVWVASALSLLVPLSYGLGTRNPTHLANLTSTSVSTSAEFSSNQQAPQKAIASLNYEFRLHVTPAHAEIWLDRKLAGVKLVKTRLPTDGSVHQVRVTAPGYVPATMWFRDAAPLSQLHLEKLPSAVNAVVKPGVIHAAISVDTMPQPPINGGLSKKQIKPAERKAQSSNPRSKRTFKRKKRGSKARRKRHVTRTPRANATTASEPVVQVIGENEPRVGASH